MKFTLATTTAALLLAQQQQTTCAFSPAAFRSTAAASSNRVLFATEAATEAKVRVVLFSSILLVDLYLSVSLSLSRRNEKCGFLFWCKERIVADSSDPVPLYSSRNDIYVYISIIVPFSHPQNDLLPPCSVPSLPSRPSWNDVMLYYTIQYCSPHHSHHESNQSTPWIDVRQAPRNRPTRCRYRRRLT
jgi:hypothetical protein